MRIIVAGGTGLIGSRLTEILRARGHDALPASPSTGIDIVSGEGLDTLLVGTDVVIDVSKPRTWNPAALHVYFTAGAQNLTRAARRADVRHYIALAGVGTAASSPIPYYRAKAAGEDVIRRSGVPFTVVHATQFFEFAVTIAEHSGRGDHLRLPDALTQPVAAADVASALVDIALERARDAAVELTGHETFTIPEFVRRVLKSHGDRREIIPDRFAHYFGARIERETLMPGPHARVLPTRLDDWLLRSAELTRRAS